MVPHVGIAVDSSFRNAKPEILRLGQRIGLDQLVPLRMKQLIARLDSPEALVLL